MMFYILLEGSVFVCCIRLFWFISLDELLRFVVWGATVCTNRSISFGTPDSTDQQANMLTTRGSVIMEVYRRLSRNASGAITTVSTRSQQCIGADIGIRTLFKVSWCRKKLLYKTQMWLRSLLKVSWCMKKLLYKTQMWLRTLFIVVRKIISFSLI